MVAPSNAKTMGTRCGDPSGRTVARRATRPAANRERASRSSTSRFSVMGHRSSGRAVVVRIDVDGGSLQPGQGVEELVLDLLGDRVALAHREGRVDLDLQVGVQPVAGPPGPGRRHVLDPGHRSGDRLEHHHRGLVGAVQDPMDDAPAGLPQDVDDDPLAGLAIALVIVYVLWQAGRSVIHRILDGTDESTVVMLESVAASVAGVEHVTSARARWTGHGLNADLEIQVDPALTVGQGHAIAEEVEHELLHALPGLKGA